MNVLSTARAVLVKKIVQMRDPMRFVMSFKSDAAKHLTPGCLVVTGPQEREPNAERRLGYCVQVRLGRFGAGSDEIFLRQTDGSLVSYENQHFYRMTAAQEALARPLFTMLPESEDYARGYSCVDHQHEVGFIIAEPADAFDTYLNFPRTGTYG
jgi:hypothetical protein